jgi:hypothetical protein
MNIIPFAALALVASLAAGTVVAADPSSMPQTRGMAGMDPRDHDKPKKEPYADCTPNAQKAAAQAEHPMPQTRGMAGMDPKAHTVDCPPDAPADTDKAKHVHRSPSN